MSYQPNTYLTTMGSYKFSYHMDDVYDGVKEKLKKVDGYNKEWFWPCYEVFAKTYKYLNAFVEFGPYMNDTPYWNNYKQPKVKFFNLNEETIEAFKNSELTTYEFTKTHVIESFSDSKLYFQDDYEPEEQAHKEKKKLLQDNFKTFLDFIQKPEIENMDRYSFKDMLEVDYVDYTHCEPYFI